MWSKPASSDVKHHTPVTSQKGGFVVVDKEKKDPSKVYQVVRYRQSAPGKVIKNGKGQRQTGIAVPRRIVVFPVIPLTLRFINNAALTSGTGIITVADVFGAIGVIGRVTNTSVTALATAFRLKRMLIYLPVDATYDGCQVHWFTGEEDREPDMEYVETRAGGVTAPQGLSFVPPKNSLVSQWYRDTYAEATQSIAITTVNNPDAVLDVDLEFTLPTAITSSQVITVATAVVGTFYRLSINRAAGGGWVPIDYQTTT